MLQDICVMVVYIRSTLEVNKIKYFMPVKELLSI